MHLRRTYSRERWNKKITRVNLTVDSHFVMTLEVPCSLWISSVLEYKYNTVR
jgi:hypothetical protein